MTFGPIEVTDPPRWRKILAAGVTVKFEIRSENHSVDTSQ